MKCPNRNCTEGTCTCWPSPMYQRFIADSYTANKVFESVDKAAKFDDAKVPTELLPTQALEEIAKVLGFGKNKYAAWNWSKGFDWSRLIGAAERHLFAFQRGEDKDPESGLSHVAHLGCCVLFLLQHELSNLGTDDRYKGFLSKDVLSKESSQGERVATNETKKEDL